MNAKFLSTLFLASCLVGCGSTKVAPLSGRVNSSNGRFVTIYSESSKKLTNVRVVGPGFDTIAAETLEPKQYCELPFGIWEPTKGEVVKIYCDGYSDPIEVTVESRYFGFVR